MFSAVIEGQFTKVADEHHLARICCGGLLPFAGERCAGQLNFCYSCW